jgi:DNA (cytosine-5)-methyltransferase 1
MFPYADGDQGAVLGGAPYREHEVALGAGWEQTGLGLYVPTTPRRRYHRPVGIDLFAGAGGFSVGFHQAGFHMVAAVEIDFDAAITYTVNLASKGVRFHFDTPEREAGFTKRVEQHLGLRGRNGHKASTAGGAGPTSLVPGVLMAGDGWISHYGCTEPDHQGIGFDGEYHDYLATLNRAPVHPDGCEHFWVADARNITGAEILDALELAVGEVDVIVGGPPCQGCSRASGKSRSERMMDPRNSLVNEFVRLVLEIRPRAMVMENVPQLLTMVTPEGIPVIDAMCQMLEAGEYGTFDALKEALLTSAGAGAALRSSQPPRRRSSRQVEGADQEPDVAEQLTLGAPTE